MAAGSHPSDRATPRHRIPNARDAHYGFIVKVDFERPLVVAVPFPLKETACRFRSITRRTGESCVGHRL